MGRQDQGKSVAMPSIVPRRVAWKRGPGRCWPGGRLLAAKIPGRERVEAVGVPRPSAITHAPPSNTARPPERSEGAEPPPLCDASKASERMRASTRALSWDSRHHRYLIGIGG